MQFRREGRLHSHILFGSHKILTPSFRLLDKAIIMYQEGLQSDNHKQVPTLSSSINIRSSSTTIDERLAEGWALHCSRPRRPFTITQRSYLDQKYDEGERSGAKWDANSVAEARKAYFSYPILIHSIQDMQIVQNNGQFVFEPDHFLTTSQIK